MILLCFLAMARITFWFPSLFKKNILEGFPCPSGWHFCGVARKRKVIEIIWYQHILSKCIAPWDYVMLKNILNGSSQLILHSVASNRTVISDNLWPHGLQPARLLCPWGFSRQKYWSGLPCPPPGNFPNPVIEPRSSTLHADSLPTESFKAYYLMEGIGKAEI